MDTKHAGNVLVVDDDRNAVDILNRLLTKEGFAVQCAHGGREALAVVASHPIDVILLDMQYFPRAEKLPAYKEYLRVMRAVAEERKIPILHRYDIMKHLVTTAQFTTDQLLAKDAFHQNDLGYGCLSDLLADAIEGDIKERGAKPLLQRAVGTSGLASPAPALQMH